MVFAPSLGRGFIRAQQMMVELADDLDGVLQFLVIAEPAAHLRNLLTAQAELAGASTGIADGQN
jgi:hypothetical protein